MASRPETPTLPALLVRPLALLPKGPVLSALQEALNAIFSEHLREGDIDFLDGRLVNVSIHDAGVEFALTLRDGRLIARPAGPDPAVRISGKLWAFLQLASRSEDSDTLFFRRELGTTGDTELGLYLKNFLDGLEPENLPYYSLLEPLLRLGIRVLQPARR